jgi:hypothetical protein
LFDDEVAPSFIGVFVALDVLPPPDVEIQPNAVNPKPWVVCTMWLAEDKDINQTFTQKVKITLPNGDVFGEAAEQFKMDRRSHTVKVQIAFVPVGIQGNLAVDVWLESETIKVADVHRYEINIYHRKRSV